MDCSAFRRHHVAYVDDTLPGDLVAASARHAAECPACARHDAAVRRSLLVARNLARDAAPLECSADFAARLEARLAPVRAECEQRRAGGRVAARDAAVPDDWAPSWRELAATRLAAFAPGHLADVPARLRTRPKMAGAAALLALTAGATFHPTRHDDGPLTGATAAAMAPFGSPFSPPPAPLAVAVEEPMFEPAANDVVGWVAYDGAGTTGGFDPGVLLGPAATGVPVWAPAVLAGEAPAVLWRAGDPGVQLISEVRAAR